MDIRVVRDNGLGLFIEGQRIRGVALIQIILSRVHEAEELFSKTIRRGGRLLRGTTLAARQAKPQQKQARRLGKAPVHRPHYGLRGGDWPDPRSKTGAVFAFLGIPGRIRWFTRRQVLSAS